VSAACHPGAPHPHVRGGFLVGSLRVALMYMHIAATLTWDTGPDIPAYSTLPHIPQRSYLKGNVITYV